MLQQLYDLPFGGQGTQFLRDSQRREQASTRRTVSNNGTAATGTSTRNNTDNGTNSFNNFFNDSRQFLDDADRRLATRETRVRADDRADAAYNADLYSRYRTSEGDRENRYRIGEREDTFRFSTARANQDAGINAASDQRNFGYNTQLQSQGIRGQRDLGEDQFRFGTQFRDQDARINAASDERQFGYGTAFRSQDAGIQSETDARREQIQTRLNAQGADLERGTMRTAQGLQTQSKNEDLKRALGAVGLGGGGSNRGGRISGR